MEKTRRNFVLTAVFAGATLIAAREILPAQDPKHKSGFPEPPPPADPREQDKNADPLDPKISERTILNQNEKAFRAGVEKLYRMALELKEDLDKTATTNVLSVRMYKKMQEIEKLAKQLKDKAKG